LVLAKDKVTQFVDNAQLVLTVKTECEENTDERNYTQHLYTPTGNSNWGLWEYCVPTWKDPAQMRWRHFTG